MKKVVSCILTLTMACSAFAMPGTVSALETSDTAKYYYVAQNGDDGNDGSEAAPFKTLEAARDKIRAEGVPQGGVTVYVREGTYTRTEPFTLSEEDSGTAESPVIYAEYPGETVVFSGSVQLDNSKFQPVTDQAIIDRLPDASKVLVYDLQAEGIPTGEIPRKMLYQPEEPEAPDVFVDNTVQVLARYPNVNPENPDAEYMTPAEVVVAGFNSNDHEPGHPLGPGQPGHIDSNDWWKQTPPTFRYDDERMDKWALEYEPFISGYFRFDWSATQLLLKEVDPDQDLITAAYPPHYGVKSDKDGIDGAAGLPKYYGFNLLCELDTTGEYYIDRTKVDGVKTDKLYLYVGEEGIGDKDVEMTVLADEIVSMEGAEYVTFSGIDFSKNQSDAVAMKNCENCTIADSEIYDNGGWGVYIDGGHGNVVDGCLMHGTAVGGVYMTGGDFDTLTPAGHVVQNCEFYEFARVKRTYSPAVEARGVGQIIRRNYIHDGPHNAILFGGNDHLIEYNEIENVLYETGDAGAIYCGKDWTSRGNVIRYNYLHDIPNPSSATYGVYLDDAFSSAEVYGNIFENFEGTACIMGGGRDNLFHDNIYINIQGGVYNFDARTFDWFSTDEMVPIYESRPITNEYWSAKYPELAETYGHLVVDKSLANAENPDLKNPMYPAGNKVYDEVVVSSSFGKIDVMVQQWGEIDIDPPTYENSQSALEIYHRTLKNVTTASVEDLDAAKADYLSDLNAAERDVILKGTPVVDGVLDDMYKDSTQLKFNPVYNDTITWSPTDQGDNTGDLYALWDEDYLYIYAIVNDGEVITHGSEYVYDNPEDGSAPNPWWNDAVEIFTNNNKVSVDAFGMRTFSDGKNALLTEEVLGSLPRAAVFLKDGEILQYAKDLDLQNLPAGYTIEGANGYAVEMAIPIAVILGQAPEVGDSVIVQAQNNDLVEYTPGATPEEDTSVFYYSMNEPTTYTLGISTKIPSVAEGMEAQTGEAVPASEDGSVAAVPYTADLSQWFVNHSENALSYELLSASAMGDAQEDAADVSAQVKIDGASLLFTPSGEDANKTVTLQVRATDGVWKSEAVTVSVKVAAVPANVWNTQSLDDAIARAESAKTNVAISTDGKDVPQGDQWVTKEVMGALEAAIQEAKQAKAEASSQADLVAAEEKLNSAMQAFNDAKAEGTQESGAVPGTETPTETPATGDFSEVQLAVILLIITALCGSVIWLQKRRAFKV